MRPFAPHLPLRVPVRVPAPVRRSRLPVATVGLAAVATLALVAGCGGDDDDLPAVEGETSPRLEVSATEMAYDPDEVAVAAGTVEIVMHNDGTILHDLRIADQPFIVEARAGETGTAQVALEEGSYDFYCSLPGHREAGMEGVLEVR
jgi:uncharacterized cupredoxin-like copper-binding protein